MTNKRRRIPATSDPEYREYALFWNATDNAIARVTHILTEQLELIDAPYVDLTTRNSAIEAAWLALIDAREAACSHISTDFFGTCFGCGHEVFTRDENNDRVYPPEDT